jgi:hypothetical protein
VADGTYQLEVSASGTDGNGNSYSPQGGRPLFIIHIGCASGGGGGGPTNQPPTVSEISGDATAFEGDDKSYSISASDPDNDPLSISWSITGGNAEFLNNVNTGSSVSLHFTDGPSTVGLQAEVNDGNGHIVTKTLSIDEANVAPTVAFTGGDTAVNESTSAHTYTYSISDPGDDTETGSPSCGSGILSNASNNASGGSFDCTFRDGLNPATASDVSVYATDSDGDAGNTDHRSVMVSNVAPSITSFTGTSSLAGPLVVASSVFTTNFSDPGVVDYPWTASYSWSDGGSSSQQLPTNSGNATSHSFNASHSFASPGCALSQSVTVSDKDGGSDSASTSINVGSAGWLPPLTNQPVTDKLKNGQVLPVKLYVKDCAGVANMSLTPVIQLAKGDLTATADDATDMITISSVSAADSGTYMRAADGFYIYNLRISVASGDLGKDFTIIVYPYGTSDKTSVRHVIIPTK